MTGRHLPNLISLFRLLLVPVVLALIFRQQYSAALVLVFVAGASDGLDGFLARRYDWRSALGGVLDPLADKLLTASVVLALAYAELLPLWLAAVVIARDVVIAMGALAYRLWLGPFQAAPTLLSKLNNFLVVAVILAVLASQELIALGPLALDTLFALALTVSLVSGGDYVWTWARRAVRERRRRS